MVQLRSLLLVALTWVVPGAAAALPQRLNDPAQCPYCHNDPALMKAAGISSHGGFQFASSDTAGIDRLLATNDLRWIESAHFELAFALGFHKVKQDEKEKIREELGRLALVLPEVDPKTKQLDPWLRAHLYAQRMEEAWKRFLEIMQVEASAFPDGTKGWDRSTKYMGEGPYLGQSGKFEVLIVPSEAALVAFLKDQFGLQVRQTQRWNVTERSSITVAISTHQGQLKDDGALHGHVVFNLAINMLDGYKHYSYDTPIWIREGLAHFMEREVDPRFNSFDASEGAVAQTTRIAEWEPEVKKLIAKGAPRMAELIALKDYAELTLPHHFATWSMVDFLVRAHPQGFACLNDKLHGRKNSDGFPDGANMPEVHREAFKECLGMSYPEFDRAWAEWVGANYKSR